MAGKQRAVVDKWKKKKEYSIVAPKLLGSVEIGQTVADKDEKVIGRVTKVNLGQVTNQFQKKRYDVYIIVNNVQGSTANTRMFALELKANFARRLVGRRCNKLDLVQYLDSKDGQRVKVKALCVTKRKVEKVKEKDIGRNIRKQIGMLVAKQSYEDIFDTVMNKDIEKELISKVKNIAEIRGCAITLVKQIQKRK
jgi:ribosomal protein S3AE